MVKDGYKFAAAPLLFGIVALGFHWDWLGAVLLLLGAFVLFFFRDPERTPPSDPDAIVSAADGRVMEVVEETRGANPGRRISIFLSIFDVHVNRCAGDWPHCGDRISQGAVSMRRCAGAHRRKTSRT